MPCLLIQELRLKGLDGFDFEAYFQASIQTYLADTAARFTICQGIFNPVFFSHGGTWKAF